ncbi:MAG TPA: helix-turn-helix domain-containing protein [Devosiaceae bacterium]|jgi:DNA-binding HxlR family transcriptional regulator
MAKEPARRACPTCATREVLDRVGDQWSFLVMAVLESGTLRFGELKNRVEGISPRVLTQTLRSLEQDGLITRHAFATIPPRVDYQITALGLSLAAAMKPLVTWAEDNQSTIHENRRTDRSAA